MSGRSSKRSSQIEPAAAVGSDGKVEIAHFSATFTDLTLPMGLKLDTVNLSGGEVAITAKPFAIVPDAPGKLYVEIGEESLRRFLNGQAPGGLKEFEVELSGGKVSVTATLKMIFEIRATAVCRLAVSDERRLTIELETLNVQSGPKGLAPKNLVQAQLDRINPIVDMEALPIDARIRSVEIGAGTIRIHGEVSPKT